MVPGRRRLDEKTGCGPSCRHVMEGTPERDGQRLRRADRLPGKLPIQWPTPATGDGDGHVLMVPTALRRLRIGSADRPCLRHPLSAPGTDPRRRPTRRRREAGDGEIRADMAPPPQSGRSAWKPIPPSAAPCSDAARSCADDLGPNRLSVRRTEVGPRAEVAAGVSQAKVRPGPSPNHHKHHRG